MRGHTIKSNCKADGVLGALRVICLGGVGFDRHMFLAGMAVFLGYYLGSKLGLALTFHPYPVSVMWPPNSILMGALLLSPSRWWCFLLLCALPAHLAAELGGGVPFEMVMCWFVSNAAEALVGAASTRLILGPSPRFDRLRALGILFLCGALLAPFLTSFLDSAFVSFNHFGHQSYWGVWRMRFCSNVFAGLVLLPVIVSWSGGKLAPLFITDWRGVLEMAWVFIGLLAVSFWVFCWLENGPAMNPALLYLPLPFIFWVTFRFGPKGTSMAVLLVAFLAIWGAVHGRGPFISRLPEQNARAIQLFFVVVSIACMFLATSIGELAQAEERSTKAFRSGPDAMIVSHLADGRIVDVNGRWQRMFGYERGETIGRTHWELDIYASRADREKLLAATGNGTSVHDLELCLRTKTGELRQVQISADTDEIGGKLCLITVIRDISDRKRAEEAQQNLAHLARLAVMGEMTAMVAHEVNQPLGAILSNTEAAELLLESKAPPLNEIRQILSDIRKSDLRAEEAIKHIGALLRRREATMQPLNLNEAVSDALQLVAGDALRRHVDLRRELDEDLAPAFGDRIYLQQVLLNLVVNGMDAMNDKPESERRLVVQTKRHGARHLEVLVKDSGQGVPAGRMESIFESFFTTKKGGMGLGLSIARSIIHVHQGRIWVHNNLEGGATFHFTIPAAESATCISPKASHER